MNFQLWAGRKPLLTTVLLVLAFCLTFAAVFLSVARCRVARTANPIICSKNLAEIRLALMLYATDIRMQADQVYAHAGWLIAQTNFNMKYAYNKERSVTTWRFSRDGVFPACPEAPASETESYTGLKSTNRNLENGSLVVWEKGLYHEGSRHVLFFDGHVELVPEAKFHFLTNPASYKN